MKLYVFQAKDQESGKVLTGDPGVTLTAIQKFYSNRHKPEAVEYKRTAEELCGVSIDQDVIVAAVSGFAKGGRSRARLLVKIFSFAIPLNVTPRYIMYELYPGSRGKLIDNHGCHLTQSGLEFMWGSRLRIEYLTRVLQFIDIDYEKGTSYHSVLNWAWSNKTAAQIVSEICA